MNKRQRKKARKKKEMRLAFLDKVIGQLPMGLYQEVKIITKPEDFQDLIQVEPTKHFIMWGK